jgi:flagellar biosynthesis/type III secretory pathway protein FliH
MTAFCIDTITPDASLRARDGVLRAASLAITTDAHVAAERILDAARSEADALLQQVQADATRRAQRSERQTLERGAQLLKVLGQANATFLERAQETIIDLAQGLFDRLVMEATPREKLEAALRRVLHEAPPKLVDPILRVHPDDFELVSGVEWEVKADPSITPGACRLEASDGEWYASFNASVEALKAAFAQAVETPVVTEEAS